MGLRYVTETESGDYVTAAARLCLTQDRDRLVPDTDPDARWLFCSPGTPIARADAQRYGLLDAPEAEEDAGKAEEDAPVKAARRPANKSRRAAANKTAGKDAGES